jgi:nitronate monooxygenase
MVNRLIRHGETPGSPRPAAYPVAYDATRQLSSAAVQQGNHEFTAQWAGQGAPLARELPAAVLVDTLMVEYRA